MDHIPCLLSSPSLFLSRVQVSSLLLDSPPLKDKQINNMYQGNVNVNISKKENTLQSLKQKKYEQYHSVLSYLYGVMHHGLLLTYLNMSYFQLNTTVRSTQELLCFPIIIKTFAGFLLLAFYCHTNCIITHFKGAFTAFRNYCNDSDCKKPSRTCRTCNFNM